MTTSGSPSFPVILEKLKPHQWKISAGLLVFVALIFWFLDRDTTPAVSEWSHHGKSSLISELDKPLGWWSSLGQPDPAKLKKCISKNGIKVRKIQLVEKEKQDGDIIWTYQVQLRVNETLIKPQLAPFEPTNDLKRVASQLKLNKRLPLGMVFTGQPKESAKKDDLLYAEYKVWVSKEETLISENLFDLFLTQDEWREDLEKQTQRINSLTAQMEQIRIDAQKWGQNELAKIPYPEKPNMTAQKWRGNSGTGEPTKSAVRVGSGAAMGAGIGALAGKTEGSLIGALAGAVAGGIYDAVSKSNDAKKYNEEERSRVAYNKREYAAAVAEYNAKKKQIEQATEEYYQKRLLQLTQSPLENSGITASESKD